MKISFIILTSLTFKVWISKAPDRAGDFDKVVDGRLQNGEFRLYFESKILD